jgi:hypothetical protein
MMRRFSIVFIVILILISSCKSKELVVESPVEVIQEAPLIQAEPTDVVPTPTSTSVKILVPTATKIPTISKPTSTLEPVNKPRDGIHFYNPISQTQVSLIEQAGATWTRGDLFHWDLIESVKQNPAVYDWSTVDEAGIQLIAANNLQLIAVVLFSPEWAQKYPGAACGPIAEAELDRFAQFMYELVKRYSQSPYHILYWEIGNEPDVDHTFVTPRSGYGCWGEIGQPHYGGEYYAEMLKKVYPKVKEANPDAQLVVGGLLMDCNPIMPPESPVGSGNLKDCSPTLFFEGILANNGGQYFDGVSFHAYDYYLGELGHYQNPNWRSSWDINGPVLSQKVSYLNSLMASYHLQEKFLICTETALVCGRDGSEAMCKTDDFAKTKAYYIAESAAAAAANYLRVNVWYSLYGWRGSELVQGKNQILPEFNTYLSTTQILKQAVYVRDIVEFPGITGYEFMRNEKRLWILWSQDGALHTISFESAPSKGYDLLGDPFIIQRDLDITSAPVYIEW